MPRTIPLLFLVSGLAALLYEILWVREIGYVLGASSPAIATVVAAYLGGLAFGAWIAGRLGWGRRRGLRIYAILELGIALTAPFVPPLLRLADRTLLESLWGSFGHGGGLLLGRFVVAFSLLFVPTALMGATLPVLCSSLVRYVRRTGEVIGRLYGLNTLGGVLGCLLAGFLFIEFFGLTVSRGMAAALNVLLALCALWLDRRYPEPAHPASSEPEFAEMPQASPGGAARALVLVAVLITSFTSIGLEMIWSRLIALGVGGTTYAFSLVLATYLLGLGAGALAVGLLLKRRSVGFGLLGASQVLLGVLLLATAGSLDDVLLRAGLAIHAAGGGFAALAGWSMLVCAGVCLLPALLLGVPFPLLAELWIRRKTEVGAGVGFIYLVSTAGGVLGSVATVFWIVPRFGLEASLLGFALTCVGLGSVIIALRPMARLRRFGLAAVSLLVGVVLAAGHEPWQPLAVYGGPMLYGDLAISPVRQVVEHHDGAAVSVAVIRQTRRHPELGDISHFSLAVNGKLDASTSADDMSTQFLLAWLPQLFHERPERMFVLGYGAGVTTGAAAAYGSRVVCAEIEQGVLDMSSYFEKINFRVQENPAVTLRVEDGRSLLRRGPGGYHVITTEPSNPWMAGMASLFTREFYELCRDRLTDDGILCQWVQLYWSAPEDYRSIVATLRSVFPHLLVFRSAQADTLLLASMRPLELDFEVIERRLDERPEVRRLLEDACPTLGSKPGDATWFFSAMLMLYGDDVGAFAGPARVIRDDHPFLEFSAARRMQRKSLGSIHAAVYAARQVGPYEPDRLSRLSVEQTTRLWQYLGYQRMVAYRARRAERLAARWKGGAAPPRESFAAAPELDHMLAKAEKAIEHARGLNSRLSGLAYHQWFVRMERAGAAAAELLFDEVTRREPWLLVQVAEDLSVAGEHARAEQVLTRCRGTAPRDIDLQLARILRRHGDFEAARSLLSRLLEGQADDRAVREELQKVKGKNPL